MPALTSSPQLLALFCSVMLAFLLTGCERHEATTSAGSKPATASQPMAHYVGSETCQQCHAAQFGDWQGSHHHLAMTPLDAGKSNPALLGDFNKQTLQHHGQQTQLQQKADGYHIRTDQQTAQPADLNLAYTFGLYPLQQYLTALPGGHWQSLPFAWDNRPAAAGGQRWFHLYADEKIMPGDPLHWRQPSHNANQMCIECHSTDFHKGYNSGDYSYQSRWQETGVGCESCHGPASSHLQWAQQSPRPDWPQRGFDRTLTSGAQTLWQPQSAQQKARRLQPADDSQVEQCAQCHSRRSRLLDSNLEKRLLDAFLPSLLEEGLYHADGQIDDEVYEYGSFLQSKMHAAGVTCSNCHNPHSGKPKTAGNGLCLQCHSSDHDTPQHTMHASGTAGSACVDCHMPTKTYMSVDARRDHSLRIPRPDLHEKIGTPDACTQCHANQSPQWAAEKLDQHFGQQWRTPHAGEVLAPARRGEPGAFEPLLSLISNTTTPAMVRATAVTLLSRFPTRDWPPAASRALGDSDALVRLAALRAMEGLPPMQRAEAVPLLQDDMRAVRIEAARVLAAVPQIDQQAGWQTASREFISSQQLNSDRASGLTNLGNFYWQQQQIDMAEKNFLQARALEPYYIPAAINLADLYRASQREADAEQVLTDALKIVPDDASLHLSYGLLLVRTHRMDAAMSQLRAAHESSLRTPATADPHSSFVYALALQQQAKLNEALTVLDQAAALPRYDCDVHSLRVQIATQLHDTARIQQAITAWRQHDPQDPALRTLPSTPDVAMP